jgi:serine/threonine-protein kinase
VHRDIKPANILACQIGGVHDTAKLLDFGLVRVHALSADAGLTGLGTIAGTPAFMAPEQAAGRADVDARSDIYSLGAVAYFLLTGQAPFVRSTSVQTMAAHLAEPLVPPCSLCPEIPDDLEGVVLQCLAKDPNQRYGDIAAVEEAFTSCECADSWSEEQAAVWWRDRKRDSVAMS